MNPDARGKAALEALYDDLGPAVRAAARNHPAARVLGADEAVAEANYQFVLAMRTLDSARSDQPPDQAAGRRAVYRVRAALTDVTRTEARRRAAHGRVGRLTRADPAPPTPPPFDRDSFAADLSEDARFVVWALLDSLVLTKRVRESASDPRPVVIRRCLRRFLRDAGWTAARVVESFDEIRRCLG